VRKIARAR